MVIIAFLLWKTLGMRKKRDVVSTQRKIFIPPLGITEGPQGITYLRRWLICDHRPLNTQGKLRPPLYSHE